MQEASVRHCRQDQFSFFLYKRKNKQNQIYALCLLSEKYSFPACPKYHTSPNTESHTQLCRGDGCWRGEREGSCGTEELKQDIPSVLMTRPVTPVMRKADVLQKVSHCLILGGMKADSLEVIFSSSFASQDRSKKPGIWLQEIMTFLFLVLPEDLIPIVVTQAFPKGNSHITSVAARKAAGEAQLFTALEFWFYSYSHKSLQWVLEAP